MNINENLVEDAITDKTRAIMPVHYAGVSCEMDALRNIADKHGLIIIEDAAQAIGSTYKGAACGTIGDFGCLSFHETKNLSMGEGGALLIRDKDAIERAEIIREKGTNRSQFYRGKIDKYTWIDVGSSYLPSELNAAYLYAQMERFDEIEASRMNAWNMYYDEFFSLEEMGLIERPVIPSGCEHNAHMFYIKVRDIEERDRLICYLNGCGISSVFHYIPLHSSPIGKKIGYFSGEDRYTTIESERLLRLPLFYGITKEQVHKTICAVNNYYKQARG
jgi:dTDP-4-amino-4,6-dideoxygalactose transaminase